jgi:hypothetical protein
MDRRTMRGDSFEAVLTAVARLNIQALEKKARLASTLARTYPECRSVFRAIETKALEQVFWVLTSLANSHAFSHTSAKGPDREPAPVGSLLD